MFNIIHTFLIYNQAQCTYILSIHKKSAFNFWMGLINSNKCCGNYRVNQKTPKEEGNF